MFVASYGLSMMAYNHCGRNVKKKDAASEKLSSGQRINRSGDDNAGLAISEKMRAQISGLRQSERNAQDAISLIQTAEGALKEQHSVIQRMRELTVQAANDIYTAQDRDQISREVSQLIEVLDAIVTDTQFNNQKLFLGLDADSFSFQVGANAGETVDLFITRSQIPSYGFFGWEVPALLIGIPGDNIVVDLSTSANATAFLGALDKALQSVSNERGNLGAFQNRLEHSQRNLENTSINLAESESRIRDTEMATEVSQMVKAQILQESSFAMLAQANMASAGMLNLLSN